MLSWKHAAGAITEVMPNLCRRGRICSRLPPLTSSHLCLCNSLLSWRHVLFPVTAPQGGNKIGQPPAAPPAAGELRGGGAGTENTLRAANKRPPAVRAPPMFVYIWLMPGGGCMSCLHRSSKYFAPFGLWAYSRRASVSAVRSMHSAQTAEMWHIFQTHPRVSHFWE